MKMDIEAIRANCDEVGDCWMWSGACDYKAPIMRPAGTRSLIPVRRAILTIQGKLQPKRFAVTSCGNPECVNPDHIQQVTRSQLQTRTAKGSTYLSNPARKARISAARRAAGTTLSMELVQEMRSLGLTSREAAKRYGCSQTAANDAIAGRTWKDYTNPFARLVA